MIGKYFPKISHFLLNSKEMPIYMNIRAIRHIIKSTVFVDLQSLTEGKLNLAMIRLNLGD
mgnify:CR=1 FL=1